MKRGASSLTRPRIARVEHTLWIGADPLRALASMPSLQRGWVVLGSDLQTDRGVAGRLNKRGFATLQIPDELSSWTDDRISQLFAAAIQSIVDKAQTVDRVGLFVDTGAALGAVRGSSIASDVRTAVVAVGDDIAEQSISPWARLAPTLAILGDLQQSRVDELKQWVADNQPFVDVLFRGSGAARSTDRLDMLSAAGTDWFVQQLSLLDDSPTSVRVSTGLRWARAIAASALLGVVGSAGAQTHSVDGSGQWLAQGDAANNTFVFTCVGGDAKLNGTDPSTGVISCTSVVNVVIEGFGGDDVADVQAFGNNEFTGIQPTNSVYFNGGAGLDEVTVGGLDAPATADQFEIDWDAVVASLNRTNVFAIEFEAEETETIRLDLKDGDDELIVRHLDGTNPTNGYFFRGGAGDDRATLFGDDGQDDVVRFETPLVETDLAAVFVTPTPYRVEFGEIERVELRLEAGDDDLRVDPISAGSLTNGTAIFGGAGLDRATLFGSDSPSAGDDLQIHVTTSNIVSNFVAPVMNDVELFDFEEVEAELREGDDRTTVTPNDAAVNPAFFFVRGGEGNDETTVKGSSAIDDVVLDAITTNAAVVRTLPSDFEVRFEGVEDVRLETADANDNVGIDTDVSAVTDVNNFRVDLGLGNDLYDSSLGFAGTNLSVVIAGGGGNDVADGSTNINEVFEVDGDTNFNFSNVGGRTQVFGEGNDDTFQFDRVRVIGGPSINTVDATQSPTFVEVNPGLGNDTVIAGFAGSQLNFVVGGGVDLYQGNTGIDEISVSTTDSVVPLGIHTIRGFLALDCAVYDFFNNQGVNYFQVERISVWGGALDDQFFVEDDCLQDGITNLHFEGGAGSNDTFFLRGSATGNTLNLLGSGGTFNGVNFAFDGTTEQLNATGFPSFQAPTNSVIDVFNSEGEPSIELTVNGGSPTSGTLAKSGQVAVGDELNVDAAGFAATDDGSTITVGAGAPINYSGIETVNLFNVLATEITSFDVVPDGRDVQVSWRIDAASDAEFFQIQMRQNADEAPWQVVDELVASGNGTRSYERRVTGLEAGRHVVRLKAHSADGSIAYSEEVEILISMSEAYTLSASYPNPFSDQANARLEVAQTQHVVVRVYDVMGRLVQTVFDGEVDASAPKRLSISGSHWASGVYFLAVEGERFKANRQMIVRH